MLKFTFSLFICVLTFAIFPCDAQVIDTLNGSVQIKLIDKDKAFVIPIGSINLERQKISYKFKLGSFNFKRKKQENKFNPEVILLTKDSIVIQDGSKLVCIWIQKVNSRHFLQIESSEESEISFSVLVKKGELFFGGGVRFGSPVLNNSIYVNLAEENGIGRGDKPISRWTKLIGITGSEHSTYYPVPFFCSNLARGLCVKTDHLFFADFTDKEIRFKLLTNKVRIGLYESEEMMNVITEFNRKNGRGVSNPDWTLGTILGVQGGTKEVLNKVKALTDHGTQLDALWIQDWVGKKKMNYGSRLNWTWQLDTVNYPNIGEIKEKTGLKMLGYINPFFVADSPNVKEGLDSGYLITNNKVKSGCFDFGGIEGYMLDVFQEDARAWMKDIIRENLVGNGFDGWMADFGEWFDVENMLDGDDAHNEYVRLWVELNNEIVTQSDQNLFFFHRSGVIGTAASSQFTWYGDQTTDFGLNDGLPSVIFAMQSSGLTGLPPGHSDIGGYTAVKLPFLPKILRSKELLIDWMRLEAFTPVFRTHEGILPEETSQVYSSVELAETFAYFSEINRILKPYFQNCLKTYREKGIPVFRHPILMGESDISSYDVFVGEDILLSYSSDKGIDKDGFIRWNDDNNRVSIYIRLHSQVYEILQDYLLK